MELQCLGCLDASTLEYEEHTCFHCIHHAMRMTCPAHAKQSPGNMVNCPHRPISSKYGRPLMPNDLQGTWQAAQATHLQQLWQAVHADPYPGNVAGCPAQTLAMLCLSCLLRSTRSALHSLCGSLSHTRRMPEESLLPPLVKGCLPLWCVLVAFVMHLSAWRQRSCGCSFRTNGYRGGQGWLGS